MPLEDLVKVIDTLQQRIKDHRPSLQLEARTRAALIDPLLTALGWDVSDPGLVTPEYDVGQGRADYALINGSDPKRPVVGIVEVKQLDRALNDREHIQMLNYVNMEGIKYAILTDGNVWKLYDVFKQAPLPERCLLNVKITGTLSHELALKLLLLWRPNLASGNPVPAEEPILVPRPGLATTKALHSPVETSCPPTSASPPLTTSLPLARDKQRESYGIPEDEHEEKHSTNHKTAYWESSEEGIRNCKYRINGEDWIKMKNATYLLLEILKWCAQQHIYGKDEYYRTLSEAKTGRGGKSSKPILVQKDQPMKEFYSKNDVDGWCIFKNLSNPHKVNLIENKLLKACVRQDGTHPALKRDLWIQIPNA